MRIDFCQEVKAARKAAKIGQTELATEIGCKQSAYSMFENGGVTKISDEAIAKLADKFGLDVRKYIGDEGAGNKALQPPPVSTVQFLQTTVPVRGFCPNPHCPSNHAFSVEGRTLFKPDRSAADPVGGRYCAICGEVLERKCPNCGAPVHEGAVCSLCGEPYVVV